MSLDVRPDHLKLIQETLRSYVPHHTVLAFGSRVHGNAKNTSDLDLCLSGKERLSFESLSNLRDAFSLSIIPYRIDLVEWIDLSPEFKEIIKEKYVVI